MEKTKIKTGGYKRKTCTPKERKRLKEGIRAFRQALEEDEIEEKRKGSGLPEDWQSRIIRI